MSTSNQDLPRAARAIVDTVCDVRDEVLHGADSLPLRAARISRWAELLGEDLAHRTDPVALFQIAADLDAAVLNWIAAELDESAGPVPSRADQIEVWERWLRARFGVA